MTSIESLLNRFLDRLTCDDVHRVERLEGAEVILEERGEREEREEKEERERVVEGAMYLC
jgi:hypothetical protein